MAKEIPKQLCLIKDVFLHGERHAFFDSKLDKRLAIISFHNSIELFFRYSLNTKSTSSDELDGMRFQNKMEEFEKLLENKIPYRSKILDLNKLRNKIYHDYLEPRKEEIDESKVITKLFLKDYAKTIFDLDFDTISSFNVENIRNPFVKDAYIEAIKWFEEKDYEESTLKFQNAFNEQWESIYGPTIKIDTININRIPDSVKNTFLENVTDKVNKLALNITEVNEILKNTIAKKNHLVLKKEIDNIYHGYRSEKINLNELTKLKGKVEEFITETDDYILEEYLQRRKAKYEDIKQTREIMSKFYKKS